MAFSFGFYNALDHDRKYDAVQVSMIFDGIINDGVYATVGKCFLVKEHPTEKNNVIVQPGRAWFDHTWNYNDADIAIEAPPSDLLRTRIDALVFDIFSDETERTNDIIWVKGTAAPNPKKPTLLKEIGHTQYPLCYVTRTANNERITQAQIENMIGTKECPFVTGLLQVISLDELLGQWRKQLDEFVEKEENDFSDWRDQQENIFNTWSTQQENIFNTWSTQQKTSFAEWRVTEENLFKEWKDEQTEGFGNWMLNEKVLFNDWRNQEQSDFANWRDEQKNDYIAWDEDIRSRMEALVEQMDAWASGEQTDFQTWYDTIQGILSGDVAGNLQNEIDSLDKRELEHFYEMGNQVTTISEDNQRVETVGEEATITTSFSHNSNGELTAERLIVPLSESCSFDYKVTTVFSNNNRTITRNTTKIPK